MGNTFITMQNIARQTLLRLQDNILMPNLCYRDFSESFSDMGDTVQVRKPVTLTANEFTDGVGSVDRQDMGESSVPVKLDKIATVDVKWGAIEGAVNMSETKLQTNFIDPAAAALAEKINTDGMKMYQKIPSRLGTAGSTPDALTDFSAIRKFLNKAKAPLSGRRCVWDVDADAKFTEITGLTKVSEAGTPQTLREGEIGRLYGLDNYMSQAVIDHQAGTVTAGGTNATGMKVEEAVTAAKTVKLISNGTGSATLSGTLKAGDVLTFGTGATAKTGIVSADAEDKSNRITVTLLENITLAADAAVAVTADYAANLAFHQNAIAFVTRPLMLPKGVEAYVATDPYNGLSVRVYRGFNTETKAEVMSMDVLYGYALVYPELATVYMG